MIQKAYSILRGTAWLLVAATVLTLFSGLFTTKYFLLPGINYARIYWIHTVLIPLIFLPLFYFHSIAGIVVLLQRHPGLNTRKIKMIAGGLWTGLFVVFLLLYSAQNPATATNMTIIQGGTQAASIAGAHNISLTPGEIANHNTANDCWLLINGKVYNVTSYLPYHPGGPQTITPYCGQDATTAFATKDKGQPHSPNADSLLASYYIGDLGGQAIVQAQPAQNQPAANAPNLRQREDD